ncbi:MAG: ABC transporter ATP-binding protein [Bacteroidia bacterium]|nr:ABC transporter ATP-binding protein [Bacteroidia bacterium]MCZ2249589.1 ABC transporter ATP-binding protein [Bacteroidia bacterium]
MSEVLIKVEGVSKKFSKKLKTSLYYGLKDVFGSVLGLQPSAELRKNEFWAISDVSFEVKRGECLGLIGHNGAGKSTLLKMLNGLIKPDKGQITMHGKIGALIELGAGFNPILTGRENVYNNAAILGFTKNEIDKKFDSIVEFAEIGEFLDMPVQNYSSGMKVRLGFAVAAQMEPDILLIDEVLAVGDIGFHVKCLNRIAELLPKTAIIFVSHSMPQVTRICTNGILMNRGKILLNTINIGELISHYYALFETDNESIIGSGKATLESFNLSAYSRIENGICIYEQNNLEINAKIKVIPSIKRFAIHAIIVDTETKPVAIASSLSSDIILENKNGSHTVNLSIPLIFSDGKYSMYFTLVEVLDKNRIGDTMVSHRGIGKFIVNKKTYPTAIGIQLPCEWSFN